MAFGLWVCAMPCVMRDCVRCDIAGQCDYCALCGQNNGVCAVCKAMKGGGVVATIAELAELKALVNQLYRARELLEGGKALEDYITELEQAIKAKAASS